MTYLLNKYMDSCTYLFNCNYNIEILLWQNIITLKETTISLEGRGLQF